MNFPNFPYFNAYDYNRGRPHSSLGPGFPEPNQDSVPASDHRHKLPAGYRARVNLLFHKIHLNSPV